MRVWIFLLFFWPLFAQSLLQAADSLLKQGRYPAALALYDSLLRTQPLPDSLRLQVYLRGAEAWADLKKPQEALHWVAPAESLALRLQDTLRYAELLGWKGVFHSQHRAYAEAEMVLQKALRLAEAQKVQPTPFYAVLWQRWGRLALDQRKYEEAERRFRWAAQVLEGLGLVEEAVYGSVLHSLALLYWEKGRYAEAESLYLRAKAIQAQVLGPEHPDYARTLHNLANVYWYQGRYGEAESLYLQVKAIRAKMLGPEHPDYALTLNNLANVYSAQGRYGEAESLYLEAKAIRAKVLGPEHPDYASTLIGLANVYEVQGRYGEAEALLLEAKAIWAKVLGPEHPDYARTLNNLANVYESEGRYGEAEALLLEAKAIWAKVLGTEHPAYYAYSLYNLARLYQRQRRYSEADTLWQTIVLKSFARIRREFPTLSTAARQNLLEHILAGDLLDFQRYVSERRGHPDFVALGYRAARSFKGLLLASTEAMKHLVETSRDTALQARYRQWKRLADQYAFFTLQEDYQAADSLWKQLQGVERAIVLRLPALKDFLPDPAGEPLIPPLRAHEALVEVVRVPPSEKTDSLLYLFYLLLPSGQRHRLELYVRAVDTLWEERAQTAYEFLRSPGSVVSGVPYRLLWDFLDSLLPPKVRVVYFAPDGVYYRVNVATLYDAQRRQFVADKYEVRYIASSRRLLLPRRRFPTKAPVVIGNPDFSAVPDTLPAGRTRSYRLFEGGIPPLPGAEVEARGVAQLLGVEPVVGKAATENFVKHLQSPQVLHVATHGYFVGGAKNPLLAGGLLLAQAAVWDSLFPPLGTDDGRLTAQEASNLNLLGTELVVLSACETGLGEVRGEGLYGLQRAFLEAGAQRVITTLWPIDDEATRELMLSFYQNWVRRKRREGVDEVFYRTLRAFRQRHPHPYYWGAFVVMR